MHEYEYTQTLKGITSISSRLKIMGRLFSQKCILLCIYRRHILGAEQDISGDGRCEGVLPAVRHLPARHQDHARHCALDFLKYCVESEVWGTLVWRPLQTANNSQELYSTMREVA